MKVLVGMRFEREATVWQRFYHSYQEILSGLTWSDQANERNSQDALALLDTAQFFGF